MPNDVSLPAEEVLEFLQGLLTYVEDGNVIELRACGFVLELQAKIFEITQLVSGEPNAG